MHIECIEETQTEMTKMEVNFDRQSKDHGLLTLPNGDAYDVMGDSIKEMRACAEEIAKHIGATSIVWNWEMPEA